MSLSTKNKDEERLLLSSDGEEYVQLSRREDDHDSNKKTVSVDGWFSRVKSVPHVGYLLMLLAATLNATIGLLVKRLSDVDPLAILLFRGIVITAVTGPYLIVYRITPIPKGKLLSLSVRGVSLLLYLVSQFYGFRYLPLGDVRTLSACMLIFVALLAFCVLREPCGAAEAQTVVVVLLGVLMVTQPPAVFGPGGDDGGVEQSIEYDGTYYVCAAVVVAGTFFQAVSFVLCRQLRDVDANVLAFWGGAVGLVPAAVALWALEIPPLPASSRWSLLGPVLLVGLLSYLGQATMIVVLQLMEAGATSVFRRALDILLAFVIQIFYFDQIPGPVSIIGSVLITVTIVFEGWRKNSAKKNNSSHNVGTAGQGAEKGERKK